MKVVYGIIRYLKGTPGEALYFKKSKKRNVEVLTNADLASSKVDKRSMTMGIIPFFGETLSPRELKAIHCVKKECPGGQRNPN